MSNYKNPNNDANNSAKEETKYRSRSRKKNSISTDEASGVKTLKFSNINKKKVLLGLVCAFLAICLVGIIYVASVIIKAPAIETDNIYSLLSQSSILYDDDGEIMDTAYGDKNRTIVEISEVPEHVQYAFIALEDKTFETHNGFNIIRIFGAIKDAFFNGGHISGTSTITQQLSRNLYLQDEMFDRDLGRKIREAYYAVQLEKELTKPEILEAYLNTIYFGSGYGVQTASQAYFSKDISEVTIAEAAALAAMPQAPTDYALVYAVDASEVTEDTPNLIVKYEDVAYLWNDTCRDRMETCLYLMHDQGYISDKEYEEALKVEIKDMVNPNLDALNSFSNFFADYAIETVINDLQEIAGYSYEDAVNLVYNGGIQIYTTMDSQAQSVVEQEFADESNFPTATGYSVDDDGNILDDYGNIALYDYDNYFNSEGQFVLEPDEFKKNEDGSVTVFIGNRLNVYTTTVGGETDYSVEFKNMYVYDENDELHSIEGGYLNIPQPYKTRDKDDNLVISAQLFEDYPSFFTEKDGKLYTTEYSLKQKTIQPQAAMTIVDNETGQVKAMIGGRNTSGRMLFNRAITPQQPGSSIKPIAVYAAGLQKSFELEESGKTFNFVDNGFDKQGDKGWGTYLTTASIVDDEPTKINGKQWPTNAYNGYYGLYTFRTALQESVNVCAVKILSQVGIDYSGEIVEKFGITTLNDDDLNLAALGLGGMTEGVSTLEMASAYSTFVNNGIHKDYSVYTKVTTRNGDLLLEPKVEETEVLDPGVAWIMTDVLRTVVSEGIAYPAAISGVSVGGKTGTTDDQFDIWFCGFTPTYSAALWIGNDINISLSSMSGSAASLWGEIMSQVNGAYGGSYPSAPSNVVSAKIDTKSGLLATEASGSHTRTEYFTSGTQPTEADTAHKTADICKDSGYLATPSCDNTESKSGIVRPYIPNTKVGDYKNELPHYYCNQHNPDPKEYPADPDKKVTIVVKPVEPPKEEKPEDSENDGDKPDNQKPDSEKPSEQKPDSEKPNEQKPSEGDNSSDSESGDKENTSQNTQSNQNQSSSQEDTSVESDTSENDDIIADIQSVITNNDEDDDDSQSSSDDDVATHSDEDDETE